MYSLVRKPCLCWGFFFSVIFSSHSLKMPGERRCRIDLSLPTACASRPRLASVALDGQWAQDEPSIRGLIAPLPSSQKKKCAQTGTPLLVLFCADNLRHFDMRITQS